MKKTSRKNIMSIRLLDRQWPQEDTDNEYQLLADGFEVAAGNNLDRLFVFEQNCKVLFDVYVDREYCLQDNLVGIDQQ